MVPRRAADVRAIYTDHQHLTSKGNAPFPAMIGEDWLLLPLEADPPTHGLYRKALNPTFGPKAVALLDNKMRLYSRHYMEAFRPRGQCDFMKEFAFEFPVRSNPGDDLISQMLVARTVDNVGFTEDGLLGLCFNLLLGGMDTVATNLGWQFYHLATHPADQHALRSKPETIGTALDELLRYYAESTNYRRCILPYEIAGVSIAPGEYVAMSTTVVGRDDREYDQPNKVDLQRRPRALSFGYGAHLCVGVHLARRELRIAMEEMLSAMPAFHLCQDRSIAHCCTA